MVLFLIEPLITCNINLANLKLYENKFVFLTNSRLTFALFKTQLNVISIRNKSLPVSGMISNHWKNPEIQGTISEPRLKLTVALYGGWYQKVHDWKRRKIYGVVGLLLRPYLGKLSLQIRTRINRIMKNKLPYCNIRFVFQTRCKISNFFTFKDKIPSLLRSGIVYKCECGSCNATYYGKTKRHFKVSVCEHLEISALTEKRVKGDDDSAIKEHIFSFCNHTPDFEDFSILATSNSDFKATLMESLLINRDHPTLNKNKESLPWELFDS